MLRYRYIILAFILLAPCWGGCASANETVRGLRGINLNEALDTERFWLVRPTEEDVVRIKTAGFNAVRLPLRVLPHIDSSGELANRYIGRIKESVDLILSKGLRVVIDVHDSEFSSMGPETSGQLLERVWDQLSLALSGYDERVMVEILNEPRSALMPAVWDSIQRRIVKSLLAQDSRRIVVLQGSEWSTVDSLAGLKPQLDENPARLVGTAHFYSPMQFTHQGAPWVRNSQLWRGRKWTGSLWERFDVDRQLRPLTMLPKGTGVYIGEFGVHRNAEASSANRWVRYLSQRMSDLDVGWFYWSYAGEFGIFDRAKKCWMPLILELLPDFHGPLCSQ
ncbi:glycoside hydrolase family 5 protein [Ramlibacter alkalitolerans]|uniref:Cellulase family glycosylhydrolase n=1 Tax=Ramlibacter alkalitolerans TaxID=2039631 RepID=A0ABS1JX57_9BURK|nr:cellulase family glycosylhydrolase [Ramlibacter alkalitolerans]MBL0428681.1 cellulase family glycosylhydrolase [Ramlibacter alkalitolerans]